MPDPLILASGSATRAGLLGSAGIAFQQIPAHIDEAAIKSAMQAEAAPPDQIASTLAELKAEKIANKHPDRLILGADQVLVCENRLFDKPTDTADARAQLETLRGKSHQLLTISVAYEHARPVWRHLERATLTMRDFSDSFLDTYLETHRDDLTDTVGGYKLEKGGAQLFSRVSGDYFSILGLPLLQVLAFLRTRGIAEE